MKRAIVLGSGGAKGLAHIGVLKALSREGLDFDIVCGTSMGALVGSLYAAGKLDALEEETLSIKIHELPMLLSPSLSTRGLFSGRNALDRFEEIAGVTLIEDLPKKYAAVCVDLISGRPIYMREGPIRQAVRASISIPAVFTPLTKGEQVLVDGGTIEPLPLKLAREMGADKILAVDLFGNQPTSVEEHKEVSKLRNDLLPTGIVSGLNYLQSVSEKLGWPATESTSLNIIEIIEKTLSIAQLEFTKTQLKDHPPEILIQPPVSHVGFLDFHRAEPIIQIGEQAAAESMEDIKQLLFAN